MNIVNNVLNTDNLLRKCILDALTIHKHKRKLYEDLNMLISFTAVMISLYKHNVIYLKYIQFYF